VNPLPSSWHWKVLVSVAWNVKVALVLLVGETGMLSMIVSGGVVSTVQVKLAGVGSVLPALSIALTWKV
jgi:hypothetical protein